MASVNTNSSSEEKIHPLSKQQFLKEDWSLLFQGAESRVYRGMFNSSQPAILKERFVKTYRLSELDEKLTKERIRAELKAYEKIDKKCSELAKHMATVLYSDQRNIVLSEISNSINVSEYITQNENKDDKEKSTTKLVEDILRKMGLVVAQIHQCGLVHGDLTASNFLVVKKKKDMEEKKEENKQTKDDNENVIVVPIDFGLSSSSTSEEDRAVDLYVLERAIQSSHPNIDINIFLDSYNEKMATDKIIKRLDQVRMRGRKRLAIG